MSEKDISSSPWNDRLMAPSICDDIMRIIIHIPENVSDVDSKAHFVAKLDQVVDCMRNSTHVL